jgi:hypothetical protein
MHTLSCWTCGSEAISIDSHWECSRPYKIFMCLKCKHIFTKYIDELKKEDKDERK